MLHPVLYSQRAAVIIIITIGNVIFHAAEAFLSSA